MDYYILVNRKQSSDVPSDIKGLQRILLLVDLMILAYQTISFGTRSQFVFERVPRPIDPPAGEGVKKS